MGFNTISKVLKGKFPQATMWIGWVENNFRNPAVKLWANLDNPFKRNNSNIFHTFGAGQKHINMEDVNYHFRKVQTWCNVNKITINLKKN